MVFPVVLRTASSDVAPSICVGYWYLVDIHPKGVLASSRLN